MGRVRPHAPEAGARLDTTRGRVAATLVLLVVALLVVLPVVLLHRAARECGLRTLPVALG